MSRWMLAAGPLAVVSVLGMVVAHLASPGPEDLAPYGAPEAEPGLAWKPRLLHALGDPRSSGLKAWPGPFDATPAVAHDFDGDGVQEVVAYSSDGRVYVFSSRSGKALAVLPTTLPPAWHAERVLNAPAAGVLRPGEPASIVVANPAAVVAAWRFAPERSEAGRWMFEKQWERRLTEHHPNPSMDAAPVLADLDGDGALEVLLQAEERGLYALTARGATLWSHGWGGGNAAAAVADVDLDGVPEVVFAGDGGRVHVLDGPTGRSRWGFDARSVAVPGSIPVSPTVADLDGTPPLEVLLTAREARHAEPGAYQDNHVAILALRIVPGAHALQPLWVAQPPWANPLSYTHLAVADLDADGEPDVLGMDWNTIGHRPGAWEVLGPAHVFALDARGKVKWVRALDAWWSNKELALAELDGDPVPEVVANGAHDGHDGFWQLDAATGRPERFLPLPGWRVDRGPFLHALRPGSMELLAMASPLDPAREREGAVLVFDTGRHWSALWPGHP